MQEESDEDKECFYIHPLTDDGFFAHNALLKIGVKKDKELRKGIVILKVTKPLVFYKIVSKILRDNYVEVDDDIFKGSLYAVLKDLDELSETMGMKIANK